MLIETIRSVTDALNHATIGVNQQLAGIVLDSGDPTPTSITLITDETRDLDTALNRVKADSFPLIVVCLDGIASLKGEVVSTIREAEVRVRIELVNEVVESHNGIRNNYYAMRGVLRCLHDFHSNDYAALRTRNGVHIQECLNLEHGDVKTFETDNQITTSIVATYLVRDTTP